MKMGIYKIQMINIMTLAEMEVMKIGLSIFALHLIYGQQPQRGLIHGKGVNHLQSFHYLQLLYFSQEHNRRYATPLVDDTRNT